MKRNGYYLAGCWFIAAAPLLFGGAAGSGRGAETHAGAVAIHASQAIDAASVADRPREQVAIWRKQVARDPSGGTGWSNLGHALVALARATSDEELYPEAEKAFRRSLELLPRNNPSARGGLARTLMARHLFVAGRAEAEAALAESPWEHWLLGLIGDAAMETGDYDTARRDYDALLQAEDGPAARARQAQYAELCGRREVARELFAGAEALCKADQLEPRAWVFCQLGDLELRSGKRDRARLHYEAALRLAPDYPVAQQRLAECFEWSDRYDAAEPLLRSSIRHTRTPELLLRLATVEERLGRLAAADSLRDEALYHMEHHYLAGDYGHLRTLARFLMDHPARPADLARGLELARIDQAARGGVYAEWTLARALRLNRQPAEALVHINRAVRLGTPEADFWLERAACLTDLGREEEAGLSRQTARRLNPLAEERFLAASGPRAVTQPATAAPAGYFSGK